MKKILITGQNSYIGNAVAEYLEKCHQQAYRVDKISLQDDSWQQKDFSEYDTILHVAGKAHVDVSLVSEETKKLYYRVNGELPAKVAAKAKAEGVRQFIHLSSVIIYGDSAGVGGSKVICADTVPAPVNFYGDSKLQGEENLKPLADENFWVAILRLPFVYGKGSKGNYPLLVKMARITSVFPNINNQRSMLYIDNLTEYIRQLADSGESGIFFPQNAEYVTTAQMVRLIGAAMGKKIYLWSALNPLVRLVSKVPGKIGNLANKAFGSLVVDRNLVWLPINRGDTTADEDVQNRSRTISAPKYALEESIRRIHENQHYHSNI